MKKFTAILLICSLLLCFVACGKSSGNKSGVPAQTPEQGAGQGAGQDDNELNNSSTEGLILPGSKAYTPLDTVKEGFIGINTVDELKAVSLNENGNYMLMADLDLSGEGNWTGISCKEGTFDGNGHRITGLTSDQSGLFNRVRIVRDLTLDVDIRVSVTKDTDPTETNKHIGCLTNYLEEYAYNCTVNGTLTYDDDGEFSRKTIFGEVYQKDGIAAILGGIAGNALDATIFQCTNNVIMSANFAEKANNGGGSYDYLANCGGICGQYGKIEYCLNRGAISVSHLISKKSSIDILVGGIVGKCADLRGCRNEAEVSLSGYGSVGGIIGGIDIGGDATVFSCQNLGKITSHGEYSSAGGIQGSSCSSDITTNRIEDCYNVGSVSGEGYAGGIIGLEGFFAGDRLGADLDIVNCAFWNQNDEGGSMQCSGIGAMRESILSMNKSDMEDIKNYKFSTMDRWMNSSGSYPVYFDHEV